MASASCTPSNVRSYVDFIDRTKFPKPSTERVPKQIGTKRLVHGEWVEVKVGDEDAIMEEV